MPCVKRRIIHTVSEDDRNFETKFAPFGDATVKILPDGRVVVGYLVVDDDCENPLANCDGMGYIHSRNSQAFYEAVGQNIYEEKYGKPNPLAVLLDCYEHSLVSWSVSGEGTQCQWDTSHSAGVWVPDTCCVEHIYYTAIKALLPEGTDVAYKSQYNEDGTCKRRPCKPGEASYFRNPDGSPANEVLDERFNNVITYTLPDGRTKGGYKNFKTAIQAAAKVLGVKLDKAALANELRKTAIVCARQACESYTEWCNGECYGVIVEVFNANDESIDEDSCWGFIGNEYAEEELKSAIQAKVEELSK